MSINHSRLYTQEVSAGGFRYSKARTDMFNAFEKEP
jgi:hypothetical protein